MELSKEAQDQWAALIAAVDDRAMVAFPAKNKLTGQIETVLAVARPIEGDETRLSIHPIARLIDFNALDVYETPEVMEENEEDQDEV